MAEKKDKTTIILFSGDLDKAMAAFIIANGAAAYDQEVTMFFTFWGLNALRKEEQVPVQKGFLEKMFSWMMPRGANKLGLSKMNMAGLGPKMIKHVMKKHNALTLPQLIEMAKEQGVKLVACTMTMDLLGIKKEELIDGVELGGVAAYLGDATEGKVNLFI
jgi:peroxiredoxin family protein